MKNALRVIAIVVVAALLFGVGYGIGSHKGINITVQYAGSASAQGSASTPKVNTDTKPVTTTAPSQQAPTTNAPAADDTKTDEKPAADTESGNSSAIPSTPEEVVNKYDELINTAKKEQNVTIHKTNNVSLECTDCSVSILKGGVNAILKAFMKPTDETYTISGGQDSAGSGKTATDFILPQGKDATLKAEGVETATATPSGDGYVINIKLKSESSTFDGTTTISPANHESAMIPLNLATLELPAGAQITKADMQYPGASIEATVDGSGKLTKVVLALPMEGSGTGELKGMSLSVGVKGQLDETYEFTY